MWHSNRPRVYFSGKTDDSIFDLPYFSQNIRRFRRSCLHSYLVRDPSFGSTTEKSELLSTAEGGSPTLRTYPGQVEVLVHPDLPGKEGPFPSPYVGLKGFTAKVNGTSHKLREQEDKLCPPYYHPLLKPFRRK